MTDITGFTIALGLVATTVALGFALLFVDLQWLTTAATTLVARLMAAPIIRADDRCTRIIFEHDWRSTHASPPRSEQPKTALLGR